MFLTPGDVRCDHYFEGTRLVVVLPRVVGKGNKLTLVFEYEYISRSASSPRIPPKFVGVWPFRFESYHVGWEFTNCPKNTELYFMHPPAIEMHNISWYSRRRPGKNEQELVNAVEKMIPYSNGNTITEYYILPPITAKESLYVEYAVRASKNIRQWLTIGGYLAIVGIMSMFFMFLLEDMDLFDRVFNVGTITAGTFSILFAIYSWIYQEEIRISGAHTLQTVYIILAVIALSIGAVLIIIFAHNVGDMLDRDKDQKSHSQRNVCSVGSS